MFQYLGFLLALAFQPCLIWTFTWGLHSDIEGPFLLQYFRRFWRGFLSDPHISQLIPRDLVSLFLPISSGISALVAGYLSVLPLVWWRFFLRDLNHPKVLPNSWGFLKFSEGLLRNCNQRTGKFESYTMLFLSWDKAYSLISNRILV